MLKSGAPNQTLPPRGLESVLASNTCTCHLQCSSSSNDSDRVIIVKAGQEQEFDDTCTKLFGSYITLNTLSIDKDHTPMSAPQLAMVLEAAHNVAPNYTLKKYQCYWYALIVFLIIRAKTGGKESNKDCIEQRGRLWWIPRTRSADDDENVVQDEYDRAWNAFKVSL